MSTDTLIDLYYTRSRELDALNKDMKEYRRELKKALSEKDERTFLQARLQADVVAKKKHRTQDSFQLIERELSGRFSQCKKTD